MHRISDFKMFYWAYTYSVAVGVPVLLPRKEKARNEVVVPLLLTSPVGGYELSSRNMGLSPGVCGLVGISQTTAVRGLFVFKNHNWVDGLNSSGSKSCLSSRKSSLFFSG
jgi:hypothetical protein